MKIFNFISNYKKAKEFDKLQKGLSSLQDYISFSLSKGSTHKCVVLKSYINNITEVKECSQSLIMIKDVIDKYYAIKEENMKINCEKLKLEVEILKMKLK